MTNILRPYKKDYILVPTNREWIADADRYSMWLQQQEEGRGTAWARTRRVCITGFVACYPHPKLIAQYTKQHARYTKFPTATDFKLGNKKIKIVHSSVNERWNIGPTLTGRVTEKAYHKGNDIFILVVYNVEYIYILGWLDSIQLAQHREGKYYIMAESKLNLMSELSILDDIQHKGVVR